MAAILFLTYTIIAIICRVHVTNGNDDYEYDEEEIYYDETELKELCQDITPDEFVPSPRGNNYFIYCGETFDESYEAKCPPQAPIFIDGLCDTEPIIDDTTTVSTTEITTTPASTTQTTIPTTTTTTVLMTTSTPKSTTFQGTSKPTTLKTTTDISKTTTRNTPSTKTTTFTSTATTNSPTKPDSCPSTDLTDFVIFLSSRNSCTQYFICYHGKPLAMYCANKLHFNPTTNKCDFPEKVNCKIIETEKPFPKCRTVSEIEFYKHPTHCNYFLCCIYGYMTVQQCPFYHNWDLATKSCIPKYLSKCYEPPEYILN